MGRPRAAIVGSLMCWLVAASPAGADGPHVVVMAPPDASTLARRLRAELGEGGYRAELVEDTCLACSAADALESAVPDRGAALVRCTDGAGFVDVCVRGGEPVCERVEDQNENVLLLRVFELVRARLLDRPVETDHPAVEVIVQEDEAPAVAPATPAAPAPPQGPPPVRAFLAEAGIGMTIPTAPGTTTADLRVGVGVWWRELGAHLGVAVRTGLNESRYADTTGQVRVRATSFGLRVGWEALRVLPLQILFDLTAGALLLSTVGEIAGDASPTVVDSTDRQFRAYATLGTEVGLVVSRALSVLLRVEVGLGFGLDGVIQVYFDGEPVTRWGAPILGVDLVVRMLAD